MDIDCVLQLFSKVYIVQSKTFILLEQFILALVKVIFFPNQNIQQHCIPLMEQRLKKKCIDLYQFWNPSNKGLLNDENVVFKQTNRNFGEPIAI